MKKIWSLLNHRIIWTIGAALLAIVAVPAIVTLVLKVLGLVHGASLHTWLHDVGHNMGFGGAAGAFGAGAAAAGDPFPPTDKDPDPCAGYQRGYNQEQALLDTIDAQRQSIADAYNKGLSQLGNLRDQFNNLKWAAQNTLNEMQALNLISACASLVADLALEVLAPELGIEEAVAGQPAAVFDLIKTVTEIHETLASSGTLEQMREWALKSALSPADVKSVLDLVNVGDAMQELAQNMIALNNQYDGMQGERDTEAQRVADAKAELDDCLASQG